MADALISGDDVFSHACLGANDLSVSTAFYDAALAQLGVKRMRPFGDSAMLCGLPWGTIEDRPLADVCRTVGQSATIRMQPGCDHSYSFIFTGMAEDIAWLAARL